MTVRDCPLCATPSRQAPTFLERNIEVSRHTALSFASRKPPEFMCHHLARCPTCDLVYADDPPGQEELAQAYHQADFDSAEEADDAAEAYIRAIGPLLAALPSRRAALEIGAGTGVFLGKLQPFGFGELVGVEPSPAAIAAAAPHLRPWLREAIFREQDFAPASFDLVCCFMTLEHVHDPKALADAVARLLRPGGAFAVVVHDWRGWVNRMLGRRSPIIDIEHMQLFSPRSVRTLLEDAGLTRVTATSFRNRYALRYWLRLLPLPDGAKRALAGGLSATGLAHRRLGMNVGNLVAWGFKPGT
jgi:SAM-dependent methyltransferase